MSLSIGRAGIGTRLAKFFDIRGGRVAQELEPTIQPVVVVADLREETAVDAGEEVQHYQGFADLDPIAAQFAEVMINLVSPADAANFENVLVRIHDVWIAGTGGPNLCRLGIGSPNFQTQAAFLRLARPTPFNAPTNVILSQRFTTLTGAAVGGSKDAILRVAVLSNDTVHVPLKVVLAPGTGFSVWSMVADLAVSFAIHWSEEPVGSVRLR